MSELQPPVPPASQTEPLPYQGPSSAAAAGPPISRLAWASMVLAPLACPCVLGALLVRIEERLSTDGSLWAPIQLGVMALATLLPVVAILRIRTSRGTRRGMALAVTALGIALAWWALLAVSAWVMKSMTTTSGAP